MSVENIVEKILSEAKSVADSVRRRSDEEITRLRAELEDEERDLREAAGKRIEGEAEEIVKSRLSSARLEARKRILGEKDLIVREVYAAVKDRILALPDGAYLDFLGNLVVRHGGAGDGKVMLCARDRDRLGEKLPRWEEDISRLMKEEGGSGSISVSEETRDIEGGLVLSRGRIEVNLSLDVILSEVKYSLERDVIRILFGT